MEEGGEVRHPAGGDGQPGGHRVPAARDQQSGLLRREHGLTQIDARDRPARAFADAMVVERDDDGGTPELFFQPPGHDADDPGVPALARHDYHAAGRRLRAGVILHALLDRLALFVQPVEFRRNHTGLIRVLRRQQADAEIGFADPPPRIDARAEREPQVAARRRTGQPRCLDQRVQADVAALGHDLQPLRDERAVQPAQLRHVGDRAERDQIEQLEQFRFGAAREEIAPSQFAQ